jgi:hypothetical protein
MKAIGGIIAWLGGMAMLLGALLFLLSLKNTNDLFIWSALGIVMGGGGLVMALIGWAISRGGDSSADMER